MVQRTRSAAPIVEPTSSHVADVPGALDSAITLLRRRYVFRHPDEVIAYLREYPHLVPVLLDAADRITRYFGPDAPLVLEVFTDPESEPEERELFALVQTPLGADAALANLYQLQDEWWLAAAPDGPGVLVIGVEPA